MSVDRINPRLSRPMAEFVSRMVGEDGLYETSSEYIRDLIRRDMERREDAAQAEFEDRLLQSYQAHAEGRYIESTGNFDTDMALYEKRKAENWK